MIGEILRRNALVQYSAVTSRPLQDHRRGAVVSLNQQPVAVRTSNAHWQPLDRPTVPCVKAGQMSNSNLLIFLIL